MTEKQSTPILSPLNRGTANNSENGNALHQTIRLQQVLTTSGSQQFVITTQVPGLQVSLCTFLPPPPQYYTVIKQHVYCLELSGMEEE